MRETDLALRTRGGACAWTQSRGRGSARLLETDFLGFATGKRRGDQHSDTRVCAGLAWMCEKKKSNNVRANRGPVTPNRTGL